MSLKLEIDPVTALCELHVQGILKRSEFASCESEIAALITSGKRPRVLVVLENFGGWERGEDWNNLDFMFTHGDKIAKIAIVGAGGKEGDMKAFTGAGLRPTPVSFFETGDLDGARNWLAE